MSTGRMMKTVDEIKRGRTFRLLESLLLACLGLASANAAELRQQVDSGWEFHQGALGSTWEIWRGDKAADNVAWQPVTMPHCFNARDSVDPDMHYYQGPGWYRTRLRLANPFPDGRTLLHFDGAGQQSKVYVGMEKVGEHVGGYDEWTVDITDAAARAATNALFGGTAPVAVLCDNSRDAEMIPSDQSDFNRYGGLYRHVYLEYVPAISLERVHVEPKLTADGNASVKIRARLYNPKATNGGFGLALEVRDPQGNVIQATTNNLTPWSGEKEIAAFEIPKPQLWSPKSPALYSYAITLKPPQGEQQHDRRVRDTFL